MVDADLICAEPDHDVTKGVWSAASVFEKKGHVMSGHVLFLKDAKNGVRVWLFDVNIVSSFSW